MNAMQVLDNVNLLLNDGEAFKARYGYAEKWNICNVCEELGIFDWWNDKLSMSQLKQMRSFLMTAIDLGFTGYVCFKVGVAGCSHGMWAHTLESTDGYSPRDGACLFHSFRNGDNYYDLRTNDGRWAQEELTLAGVKKIVAAM